MDLHEEKAKSGVCGGMVAGDRGKKWGQEERNE